MLVLVSGALALLAASAGAQQPPMLGDAVPVQQNPLGGNEVRAPIVAREEPAQLASPPAVCGPGSRPAPGLQGRVPANADPRGYECNLSVLGREGKTGGFKVERFVDKAGHECAYYDTTLLFPGNAASATLSGQPTGTAVLDLSDPTHPRRTATLVTPAMQTPHESLLVNPKRGLLAAVMGNPAFNPGFIDIYDLNADCRQPQLMSSSPVGILGHESGFAPDGKTFYATSISTGDITAVDVSNPRLPLILGRYRYPSHGLTISDDGNRGYIAGSDGLQVIDTSEVQARKPSPQVRDISGLTWKNRTIPQVAIPVTIGGKPFLVEIDEYSDGPNAVIVASNGPKVGAGRIIDISNERAPKVVSNFRLAVHQEENRAAIANDPGASFAPQGYAGHYCSVPSQVDPGIVACSFIVSGLRVFDIRDPYAPKELSYFVAPPTELGNSTPGEKSNYAMSKPAFDVGKGEIWYSDGNSGFYALKSAKGVWPFETSKSAVGLPTARRCASRRSFPIRLRAPKGQRLLRANVFVSGKRVRVLKGRRLTAQVNLVGLPKGAVKVSVIARTTKGKLVRETRTYRTCTKRS